MTENDLAVVAVLSGNRNFEGRIHPLVRASYLASPPLVVAYALAGHVDVDLSSDPWGRRRTAGRSRCATCGRLRRGSGRDRGVGLGGAVRSRVRADLRRRRSVARAPDAGGSRVRVGSNSTYVREPPFFANLDPSPAEPTDIAGARCLVKVGDSITTDHISPAGSIKPESPAGRYLLDHGVEQRDFNSYGARRGITR